MPLTASIWSSSKRTKPFVHQDLVDCFADKDLDGGEWEYDKKVQKGHGRREVREIWGSHPNERLF
jgi:hypothetical protein